MTTYVESDADSPFAAAALIAAREGRMTIHAMTGFRINGQRLTPAQQDDIDELWMDDLLDAARDPEPGYPEPVSITPAGRDWLAAHDKETDRG